MRPIDRRNYLNEIHEGAVSKAEEQKLAQRAQKRILVLNEKREKLAIQKLKIELEQERIKFVKLKEFVQAFGQNKKREYSHELWLSVKHASLLFPSAQLAQAHRRLRGMKGVSFEQKVLARIIILPKEKYLEVEKILEQEGSHGLFFMGLTFVLEDMLKKKGVLPSAVHEVSHLIDYFARVERDEKGFEAMAEARALFACSLMSQKVRNKALNQAQRRFKSITTSKEYEKGLNLGRAIFILADFLRMENGASEGEKFICEIAKHKQLNEPLAHELYEKALNG